MEKLLLPLMVLQTTVEIDLELELIVTEIIPGTNGC